MIFKIDLLNHYDLSKRKKYFKDNYTTVSTHDNKPDIRLNYDEILCSNLFEQKIHWFIGYLTDYSLDLKKEYNVEILYKKIMNNGVIIDRCILITVPDNYALDFKLKHL